MIRTFMTWGLLLVAISGWALAADDVKSEPKAPTNPALEKLKKLTGTWMVADDQGKPTSQVASVFKLTAGGSAIHETIFPGEPMEMVSVYTPEGSEIIMTHYCVLGNQPRMKGRLNAKGNQIEFQFVGGGNLDPAKDKHMHSAIMTFVDEDHIEINGTGWENGGPTKEMCCGMKLVRKK